RGHLEAVASGGALARDARTEVASRRSAYLQERARTVGAGALTARDVADGEAAGDEVCTALMLRARRAIASACVGFVVSFNPHRLIIGGSIAEGQGDRLLDEVRAAIRTGVFPVLARPVEVVAPTLGPDVSLAGAPPLVLHRLPTDTAHIPDPTDTVGATVRPAVTTSA